MKHTLLASACLAVAGSLASAATTVQSCNRSVTFDTPPERAISNDVNLTEMMLVLGLTDRMVGYTGISGWKTLDEEMRAGVEELPELSSKYPSKEVLVGADADFFFAGWNYGMKVGGEVTPETLEPFGIKVYELTESCTHIMQKDKASIEDMYADLLNLGAIFGVEDKANTLVEGYRAEVAELTAATAEAEPLRVCGYDLG
mgnify:CR=1 FL=1